MDSKTIRSILLLSLPNLYPHFVFGFFSSSSYPQWNISDYFFQRGEAITQELEREEEALQKQAQEKGETLNRPFHPAPPFDCLWLCLYAKLGELCVDPRPAVRKSAGQTLFSTIAAHGTLLQQPTWHIVVWKVQSLKRLHIRWKKKNTKKCKI